ncbi:RnfABCDGE type electron transport complex subunit D [Ruminococcus flavefaciens]|jgi:Na+-translocating ferredoxin:NAD+ oxidoreductase RnfD subunit|uniref:RnfABCDGE type electron transport complex subunit D n=1 Tax=Ruminococcus flavefaciens TaxID=1265 RepID=UPI0013DB9AD2|nr:RnfABCDGE type electron transport complex subunit D [Ruminococcus flavefaciens]
MQKKTRKERLIWLDIMITLLTLELMSYFYYGIRSVFLAGICVVTGFVAELVSLRFMKRSFTADDLTCTSDALILALMFPAVMDYHISVIAVLFAILVAKNLFGGRLNMIFSPAAAAFVFVLTSWDGQLLQYTEPHVKTGLFETPTNLVRSASYVFDHTGTFDHSDFEVLLGNFSGPAGAVSILLLVVAAIVLMMRRSISAGAFLGTIFGTGLFAVVTPMVSSRADSLKYSLVTNMVLFSAIYIVSDLRIAPKRDYYAFFYGLFIGVISYVLVLTGAKENAIVIVSVLFTPIALGFRHLEKKIDTAEQEHSEVDAGEAAVTAAGEEAASHE